MHALSIVSMCLVLAACDKEPAEGQTNRKDFSIVYAGTPDDLSKDAVLMKIAARQTTRSGRGLMS